MNNTKENRMSRKSKMPDPSTADRVEYVTPDELRERGGWAKALWARVIELNGWYSYTEYETGTKVLLIAR